MKKLLHHIFPLSIRLQLTFWYISVFTVLLCIAGFVLYKHLETSLASSLDSTLQVRTEQLAGGISDKDGKLKLSDVFDELPGMDADTKTKQVSHGDVNWSSLVRILDRKGHPLSETPAFHSLQVPADSVTAPLHGTPWDSTVLSQDGNQVRLYSRTVTQDGKVIAVIQVGESLSELQESLHHMAKELLEMGAFVLLISAIGSYWLASRSLLPIQHLTRTARTIKGGDLHQRVPVPKTYDEVHFLAVTLNEMLGSLEDLFNHQRRFVADASHELRTPVAVIRSKTDIALMEEMPPQEYMGVLREINQETERLSRLINDLLVLARGDEGQIPFEREPLRLDQLAEMVTANAEQLAVAQNISLNFHADGPVTVLGDEGHLIQVIMNLVDNAISYTNPGGTIMVRVQIKQQQARLSVQDTGIGISEHDLQHIFERFYRADPARRRREGSNSGLGLAIVDWIIRTHGGTIAVESRVGAGSTFLVTLPLANPTLVESNPFTASGTLHSVPPRSMHPVS